MNEDYATLLDALNGFRAQGYTKDFNLAHDRLECTEGVYQLFPEDFVIDAFYRFEGDSNPSDESIVYAISSTKHNVKGVMVNAFGIYSDAIADSIASKLKI
jgi:hypothetical protein